MKKIIKAIISITFIVTAVLAAVWIFIAQPTWQKNAKSSVSVAPQRLKAHVEIISKKLFPRNYKEITNLNSCAEYIAKNFAEAGAEIQRQEFTVEGNAYVNVIGRFGKGQPEKIIVGAHYDAVQGTPGADDNASGVAGLIELSYLIGKAHLNKGIELVAYSLEEPPFFGTDMMGSVEHASSIRSERIKGVIVLEMIGYYNETWGSQSYPMPLLNFIYPNRGNFIGIVGKTDQKEFTKKIKIGMKGTTDLPVYSINAPESVPGIDFSDHRNYWPYGLNAVMITDTAFYRNKEYHKIGDTLDRLDYNRMSKVVVGVFEAIRKL